MALKRPGSTTLLIGAIAATLALGCGGPQTTPAPAPAPSSASAPHEEVAPPAPPKAAEHLAVTGIDPEKGDADGGTYVRIMGTRFTEDGARNVKVYFGARQGTVVRFASDSELIVEAPGGTPNQTVDLTCIFEPGGEIRVSKAFTFITRNPQP